jgi:hyperosmotically inducible periplasmic protein
MATISSLIASNLGLATEQPTKEVQNMTSPSPRSYRKIIASLFALLILAVSGNALAAKRQQPPPRDSANYEAWLTKEVHHELVLLPFYSVFDNLEYKVEGSKVTLMGQVVQPVVKDDAESAVKHIEGVTAVDDQIKVLPLSPMDNQIRRAEYRAIYAYPSLQVYALRSVAPIHIIVDNGHVTLEGVVATQADKDTANVVANTVPNVFSVTNNLRVEKS